MEAYNIMNLFGDYPHQEKAVIEIEKAWDDNIKSVCYQACTGSGKTRIIRRIVENHYSMKKTICIIVHRRNLVDQLSNEMNEAEIRHGIIASNFPYIRYRVQVASLQTIVRRLDNIQEPQIIIIDEVHHCKSKSYMKIIKKWPNAKILGMSATPLRTNGEPLSDVIDKLIIGPPMRELIDAGFLSDYDYFAPSSIDMSGVHRRGGDYVTSETEEKVGRKIVGDAVDHYRRHADHLPAIVSCASIAHADSVARQFADAGYRAKAVHSELDQDEIQAAIDGLKTGEIELLMQCELLGEGIDIPGASVLIGLRPTASVVVFLQHVGRVLRRANGKGRAIILDHVSNWERHGLPDDPRQWSLDGADAGAESGESKYKRCPDCMRPIAKALRKCPHCGHEWIIADAPPRMPDQVAGELVAIRSGDTRITADYETIKKMIVEKARSLKEANEIAREFGGNHKQAWYVWTQIMRRPA